MPRAGDSHITTLNLSANNIGDGGALALAEMLKVNTLLHVMFLLLRVHLGDVFRELLTWSWGRHT